MVGSYGWILINKTVLMSKNPIIIKHKELVDWVENI